MFNSYQINTLELNSELCNGCTMCVMVCPHHVFEMQAHKAVIVHYSACMECGACKRNCAADAIQVHSGVGCASAMIRSALSGKPETCSCC